MADWTDGLTLDLGPDPYRPAPVAGGGRSITTPVAPLEPRQRQWYDDLTLELGPDPYRPAPIDDWDVAEDAQAWDAASPDDQWSMQQMELPTPSFGGFAGPVVSDPNQPVFEGRINGRMPPQYPPDPQVPFQNPMPEQTTGGYETEPYSYRSGVSPEIPSSQFAASDTKTMSGLRNLGYADADIGNMDAKTFEGYRGQFDREPNPKSLSDRNLDLLELAKKAMRKYEKENPGKSWGRYLADRAIPGYSTGKQLGATWNAKTAIDKIDSEELSDDDALRLARYLNDMEDDSQRSGWKLAGDIVANVPAFVGELVATGPAGAAAKKGARNLAVRLLNRKIAARGVAGMAARGVAKTAGVATDIGVRSALIPQRVGKSAVERQMQHPDESWIASVVHGFAQNAGAVGSEMYGGKAINALLGKPLRAIGAALAKKTPAINPLRAVLVQAWAKLKPGRSVQQAYEKLAKAGGWDGILGELGEERINELILGTAGALGATGDEYNFGATGDIARGEFSKAGKQLGPELAAFTLIPGAAIGAAAAVKIASLPFSKRRKVDTFVADPTNGTAYREAVKAGMPPAENDSGVIPEPSRTQRTAYAADLQAAIDALDATDPEAVTGTSGTVPVESRSVPIEFQSQPGEEVIPSTSVPTATERADQPPPSPPESGVPAQASSVSPPEGELNVSVQEVPQVRQEKLPVPGLLSPTTESTGADGLQSDSEQAAPVESSLPLAPAESPSVPFETTEQPQPSVAPPPTGPARQSADAGPSVVSPVSEGVLLTATFPPSEKVRKSLSDAAHDPFIGRLAEIAGVKEIRIDAPYTFGITQEGELTASGVVRINPNADDAAGVLTHELGHIIWHRASDEQKQHLREVLKAMGPRVRASLPGFEHGFANDTIEEQLAQMFDVARHDPAMQRHFNFLPSGKTWGQAFPEQEKQRNAHSEPTSIVPWDSLDNGHGDSYVRKSHDVRGMVAKYGDVYVRLKDVNGGRHIMPASMAADILDTSTPDGKTASGYIRNVMVLGEVDGSPDIKLDNYTLSGLPDLSRAMGRISPKLGAYSDAVRQQLTTKEAHQETSREIAEKMRRDDLTESAEMTSEDIGELVEGQMEDGAFRKDGSGVWHFVSGDFSMSTGKGTRAESEDVVRKHLTQVETSNRDYAIAELAKLNAAQKTSAESSAERSPVEETSHVEENPVAPTAPQPVGRTADRAVADAAVEESRPNPAEHREAVPATGPAQGRAKAPSAATGEAAASLPKFVKGAPFDERYRDKLPNLSPRERKEAEAVNDKIQNLRNALETLPSHNEQGREINAGLRQKAQAALESAQADLDAAFSPTMPDVPVALPEPVSADPAADQNRKSAPSQAATADPHGRWSDTEGRKEYITGLFTEHNAEVERVANRISQRLGLEDADAIASDFWDKINDKVEKYDPAKEPKFMAWANRVLQNIGRDLKRRQETDTRGFEDGEAENVADSYGSGLVAGMPPVKKKRPLSQSQTSAWRTSMRKIFGQLADLVESFGREVALRVGKVGQGLHAQFDPHTEVARIREANDLDAAAHEMAHAIEKLMYGWPTGSPWQLPLVSAAIKSEMMALGKSLYGSRKPTAGYKREGWAEFFRLWLTDMPEAIRVAPELSAWFLKTVVGAKPQTAKLMRNLQDEIQAWDQQGPVNRAKSGLIDMGSLTERVKRVVGHVKHWFGLESHVEMLYPMNQLVQEAERHLGHKLPSQSNPYKIGKAFRMTEHGVVHNWIKKGLTDLAGNPVGPALQDAQRLIPHAQRNDFTVYLWARRALALWLDPEGPRHPGLSLEDAASIVKQLDNKTFRKAANIVYRWNDGVLDYVAESSPTYSAMVDAMRARDPGDYIPLSRYFAELEEMYGNTNAGGGAPGRSLMGRLRGSGREIKDPFPQMISNASQMVRATHERLVLDQIKALSTIEGMGHVLEQVPPDQVPVASRQLEDVIKEVQRKLKAQGANMELQGPGGSAIDVGDLIGDTITFFSQSPNPHGPHPIVAWYDKGKVNWFYVPGNLYYALKGMETASLPLIGGLPLLSPLAWLNRAFKFGTVGILRPSFGLIANVLRDLPTFFLNTQSKTNYVNLFGQWMSEMGMAFADATTGGKVTSASKEWFDRWGVSIANSLGEDTARTRELAREGFAIPMTERFLPGNWMENVKDAYEWFRDLVQFPESATRAAEIKLLMRERGITPGTKMTLADSIDLRLAAKEVTVDFSAAGEFASVWNQMTPFYNVMIQAPRAALRAARRDPAKFATRAATLAALTLLLWWDNKDKDWYKRMQGRGRFLYWNIENGDEIIKIPKSTEPGILWAGVVEALADAAYRDNPEAMKEWFAVARESMTPGLPHPLGEIKDQLLNRDDFWDSPVVPRELDKMPTTEQFDERTTIAAKRLGAMTGMSPKRIDHAISGLFGHGAIEAADIAGVGRTASTKEAEAADTPLAGRLFVRGGTEGLRSKYVDQVYDRLDVAKERQNSKETPETAAEAVTRISLDMAAKTLTKIGHMAKEETTVAARRKLSNQAHQIASSAISQIDKTGASSEPKNLSPEIQDILDKQRRGLILHATESLAKEDRTRATTGQHKGLLKSEYDSGDDRDAGIQAARALFRELVPDKKERYRLIKAAYLHEHGELKLSAPQSAYDKREDAINDRVRRINSGK